MFPTLARGAVAGALSPARRDETPLRDSLLFGAHDASRNLPSPGWPSIIFLVVRPSFPKKVGGLGDPNEHKREAG
jgi:hypothetical protein